MAQNVTRMDRLAAFGDPIRGARAGVSPGIPRRMAGMQWNSFEPSAYRIGRP